MTGLIEKEASVYVMENSLPLLEDGKLLNKKTLRSSETPVTIYQSTQRNIPEELNLHQRSCENIKTASFYLLSVDLTRSNRLLQKYA
jgi:hypothetical protein